MPGSTRDRNCSRDDWLKLGLDMLVQHGHEALRVAPLASALGVTKGSFYWHFVNVGEFHDALLEHWHKHYISAAPKEVKRNTSAAHPLQALGAILQDRKMPAIDTAIRRWAEVNPKARAAIDDSERFRRKLMTEMLVSSGVERKTAEARAQIVVWAWRGSSNEPNARWRMKAMAELFGLLSAKA